MADAVCTITIDTASSPWVMQNGEKTSVSSNDQTLTMYIQDEGDTAYLEGYGVASGLRLNLANGSHIQFSSDPRMVTLGRSGDDTAFADTVAKKNPGSLWVSEDDGPEVEVKVTTMTIADADSVGGNNITTMTMEYPGKPWQWIWVTLNTA